MITTLTLRCMYHVLEVRIRKEYAVTNLPIIPTRVYPKIHFILVEFACLHVLTCMLATEA